MLRLSFCLHTNQLLREALHPLLKVHVCGLLMVTSDWIFRNAIPGSKVSGVEVISRFAVWRSCGESGTVFIDEQVTRDLYWLSKYLWGWWWVLWLFHLSHFSAEQQGQLSGLLTLTCTKQKLHVKRGMQPEPEKIRHIFRPSATWFRD